MFCVPPGSGAHFAYTPAPSTPPQKSASGLENFVTNAEPFRRRLRREVTACDSTFPDLAARLVGFRTHIRFLHVRQFVSNGCHVRVVHPPHQVRSHATDRKQPVCCCKRPRAIPSVQGPCDAIASNRPVSKRQRRNSPLRCFRNFATSSPSSRPGSSPEKPSRGTEYG